MTLDEAEGKYYEYLDGHIGNVQAFLEVLNKLEIPYVTENYDKLKDICSKHDKSKYEDPEFEPYRKHFYPINDEEKLETEAFYQACDHHTKHNKHHWDYWVDEDGNLDIPDEEDYKLHCVERCCDWLSMSYQHNEIPDEWYNANKEAITMPDYGFDICDEIMNKVAEFCDGDISKVNDLYEIPFSGTRGELDEAFDWQSLTPRIEADESDMNAVEYYKGEIEKGNHRCILVNSNGEILDGNHTMTAYQELGVRPPKLYLGERPDFYRAVSETKGDAEKAIDIMIKNGTAKLIEEALPSKEFLDKSFKVKYNDNNSSAEIIVEGLFWGNSKKSLESRVSSLLKEAKKLTKQVFGNEFFKENDTNPYITVDELKIHNAGVCEISFDNNTEIEDVHIKISKYVEDFDDSSLMTLVLHEYAHSLKCCIYGNTDSKGKPKGGHNETWNNVANKLASAVGVSVSEFMNAEDGDALNDKYKDTKSFYYKITCQHCGESQLVFSANNKIVKNVDNYRHECKDGTDGEMKVEKILNKKDEVNESFEIHRTDSGYLLEASMGQLKRTTLTQDPTRAKKSKNVQSKYLGISKYGVLNFSTSSETHSGVQWYQEVQFPSFTGFMNIVKEGDEIDATDVKKAMQSDNIKISCDDPSFLYWAWKYKAWRDVYGLEKETRAPKRNNIRLKGALCKHLYSVIELLNEKRIIDLIARDLTMYCKQKLGIKSDGYQDAEGMMQKDFKANQYDYSVEGILKTILTTEQFNEYLDGTKLEDLDLTDEQRKDIEDAIANMRDRSQFDVKSELERQFQPVKRGRKITRDDVKLSVGEEGDDE